MASNLYFPFWFVKVMIMGKSKKQYIGAIEDESEAAQIYDWHAIVT